METVESPPKRQKAAKKARARVQFKGAESNGGEDDNYGGDDAEDEEEVEEVKPKPAKRVVAAKVRPEQ